MIGGYSLLDGVVTPNAGAVWVVLDHWDDRSSDETQIQAIVDSLNRKFARHQGRAGLRGAAAADPGAGHRRRIRDAGPGPRRNRARVLQQSALDLVGEGATTRS